MQEGQKFIGKLSVELMEKTFANKLALSFEEVTKPLSVMVGGK